jgi:hypothetical protein
MFGLGGSRGQAAAPVVTVVQDETAEVHTAANPYCGNLSCWCHTDVDYHFQVTGSPASDGQDTDRRTGPLGMVLDDDAYEAAMALLMG